ncbi:MAG: Hsp20/alpha crystallin family protein [Candidatus Nealsonbacteria bacterium]|nr:Hsp20/alpha crystallin family protein [Candidatus Nealsonbacteria bacterium]
MSFLDKLKQNIAFQETKKEGGIKKPKNQPKAKTAKQTEKNMKIKKEVVQSYLRVQSDGQLAIDVYETENEFIIRSAIAGIKTDDLDISIENGIVAIRGNRVRPDSENPAKYIYQECYWGPFSRQVMLPEEVDNLKAEASMKNGVFVLKIPKLKKKTTKKIVIKEEISE